MAPNVDHYMVSSHSNYDFNVHFNNTNNEHLNDKAIEQGLVNGFIAPLPGSVPAGYDRINNTTSVYRKMSDGEVQATVATKGLAPSARGTNSRKYITDNYDKVRNFQNNILSAEQLQNDKIVEFRVNRKNYEIIKKRAIPQQGARRVNPTADVFNTEGIRPGSTDLNLGIHKNNIAHFNNNVKDVLVLNPKSPWVTNKFLRYVSTHKFKITCVSLAVVFEGINIGIAVHQDGGRIGQNTVQAMSSAAGSAIGAAIFSIIPGVGTILGGFLGGLIGGFIGSGIGSLICSYFFPHVAPGRGPPLTEYVSLVYALPECEFKNEDVYGPPATEYRPNNNYGTPGVEYGAGGFGSPDTEY